MKNIKDPLIGIVLGLLVVFFAYLYYSSVIETLKLDKTVAVEKANAAEVERDNALVELSKRSASRAATTVVLDEVQKLTGESNKQSVAIVKDIKEKISVVEKKYSELPQNIENNTRKKYEISSIRLNGLWVSYCVRNQTDIDCT